MIQFEHKPKLYQMKTYTLLLLLSFITITASAQSSNPLVTTEWLQQNLDRDDLVLFHIGRQEEYDSEHIPGAVFIDASEYTYGTEDRSVIYDLPSVDELKILFESKGLDDGDTVVIYTGTNWVSPSTRLYFTMTYLGYSDHTFFLDGGFPKWKADGGAVADDVPKIKKGTFTPHVEKDVVTDRAFVESILGNDSYNIVDARSPVYYQGIDEGMGGKKGHLPGAKTIPYTSVVSEGEHGGYSYLPNSELQKLFDAQGLDKRTPIVVYCHIGQQATAVFFAARKLGYNVRLYDGSFHDWATHDMPVVVESE